MVDRLYRSIKKLWCWFTGSEYIFEEICCVFTLVSIVNSCMMVLNIDTPKTGEFTYMHLLLRLFIISVIIITIEWFDGENIFQEIMRIKENIRGVNKISDVFQYITENKFSAVSVTFTFSTILICLYKIVIDKAPKGGVSLYSNLLLLFGVITSLVIVAFILSKMRWKT